jgi:ribose transport system permease protein
VLQNLVNMLGIPSSLNFAVMGAVILLGVIVDGQLQRNPRSKGGAVRPVAGAPSASPAE